MVKKMVLIFGIFYSLSFYCAQAGLKLSDPLIEIGFEEPAFPKKLRCGKEATLNLTMFAWTRSAIRLVDAFVRMTFEDGSVLKIPMTAEDKNAYLGFENYHLKFLVPHFSEDQKVKIEFIYQNKVFKSCTQTMRFLKSAEFAKFLTPVFLHPAVPGARGYVTISLTPFPDKAINFKDLSCTIAVWGHASQEKKLSQTDLFLTEEKLAKVGFTIPEMTGELEANFSIHHQGKLVATHREKIRAASANDSQVMLNLRRDKVHDNYCHFCNKIVQADMDWLRKSALKSYDNICKVNRMFIEDEKLCIEIPPGVYYEETKVRVHDPEYQAKHIVSGKSVFSISGSGISKVTDQKGNILKMMPSIVSAKKVDKINKCYHIHIPRGVYPVSTTIMVNKGELE